LDAEQKFNFRVETKMKIKALLLDLQRQRSQVHDQSVGDSELPYRDEGVRNVIDILTSVLFEAV